MTETASIVTGEKRPSKALRKNPKAPKRFKSSYICFFVSKQKEIKREIGQDASVSNSFNLFVIHNVISTFNNSLRLEKFRREVLKCGTVSRPKKENTGIKLLLKIKRGLNEKRNLIQVHGGFLVSAMGLISALKHVKLLTIVLRLICKQNEPRKILMLPR